MGRRNRPVHHSRDMSTTSVERAQQAARHERPWWIPELTDELRYGLVVVVIAFGCLKLVQNWFDKYEKKRVNKTDDMLSRMFWGVTPESTQQVQALGKKLLYLKLGFLCMVVLAGIAAMHSLCKDSLMASLATVLIVVSLLHALWTERKKDKEKEAEEEKKKGPKLMERGEKGKLPVTIVTGFLGAGKTTLVNHILHEQKDYKILVIENEVGEEGIDNKLLVDIDTEDIVLLSNGCICCKVRSDLIQVLKLVLEKPESKHLDGVLIETTGIADPAAIVQTFMMDDDRDGAVKLKDSLSLDSVLCMVDGKHILQRLDEEGLDGGKKEMISQMAFADIILVNKLDLISTEEMKEVASRVASINSEARVICCEHAKVNMADLLGLESFDPMKATAKLREQLDKRATTCSPCGASGTAAQQLMQGLTSTTGHGDVSTISIVVEGQMDLTRLNRWLGSLLKDRGDDLFRMKGIVAVEGKEEMFIFHGVHMLFNGKPGPEWPKGEARNSRMVFIGRKLDGRSLRRGFESCVAKDTSKSLLDME